jgi:FKBP-type peptidyl-prolyl cis-trans isomerase
MCHAYDDVSCPMCPLIAYLCRLSNFTPRSASTTFVEEGCSDAANGRSDEKVMQHAGGCQPDLKIEHSYLTIFNLQTHQSIIKQNNRMKRSAFNTVLLLLTASHALGYSQPKFGTTKNRRNFLASAIATASACAIPTTVNADIEGVATPSFSQGAVATSTEEGVKLYTTKSGLKYIVLKEGSPEAKSPRYGQLVNIAYKSFIKLPNANLEQYDSDKGYLIKHGNGRQLPGLDEGLHTMKIGEKRRLIIPPKLGYVGPGVLGPLPESAWGRYQLNKLLDKMVEVKAGNVVVDVELRSIMDDEADQGYYEDDSLSPEDFNTLRDNLSVKAREARDLRQSAGKPSVDLLSGAVQ